MNKAKKRGNLWRILVYDYTDENGKIHNKSISAPTKAECEYKAVMYKSQRKKKTASMTVKEALDKYIELRPLLSPTTLTSYLKMEKFAFQSIMDTCVDDLDDIAIQKAVNEEAQRISERTGKPISIKTVKNEYGLLASALKTVCRKTFTIGKLEQQKHIKSYPEIPDVLQALKGTDIELPCLLALWLTFSMSEIRGIKCSDIKNGYITINRVIVDTKDGAVIKDNAKVSSRLRRHIVPPYIMSLIEQTEEWKRYQQGTDGFLITRERGGIYRKWKRIAKDLGYDLTFHDLRHLSASAMLFLGVPQKYAMERGGWSSPSIMTSVYQHTLSDERQHFDEIINTYFEQNLTKTLNQNAENH